MAFDLQPVLQGTLLRLRPLHSEDFAELYQVASDPLIWELHPAHDRYQEKVFRRFFQEGLDSRGAFAVVDIADGKIIGSSRFHGYDAAKSEIEIGWSFLARQYWGGRYNREMKYLMLQHAFTFVNTVIFLVGPENYRSQRAMEKIGGSLVGKKLNSDGMESLVYQIQATDFLASNASKKRAPHF